MRLTDIITLVAMFLAAGAPVLGDTTPGSPRSIVVATSGVLLAIVVLLNAIGTQVVFNAISRELAAVKSRIYGTKP